MQLLKEALVAIILWILLLIAFYYQDQTFAFEAVEREVVSDALYTLAEHTDFLEVLHECTIERSYRHRSDWLYLAIDQTCSYWEATMIVDVLSERPTFERLDKVPLYPSMS